MSVEASALFVEASALSVEASALFVETPALSVEASALFVEASALSVEASALFVETPALSVKANALFVEASVLSVEVNRPSVRAGSSGNDQKASRPASSDRDLFRPKPTDRGNALRSMRARRGQVGMAQAAQCIDRQGDLLAQPCETVPAERRTLRMA